MYLFARIQRLTRTPDNQGQRSALQRRGLSIRAIAAAFTFAGCLWAPPISASATAPKSASSASRDTKALPPSGQEILIAQARITLGDLSAILPQELNPIDVGPSPAPGQSRWVTRAGIKNALIRAGADPRFADAMPAYLKVTRDFTVLDKKTLSSQLRRELAEKLPQGVNIAKINGIEAQNLPVGPYAIRSQLGPIRNTTTATISLISGDRAYRTFPVQLILSGDPKTPVLTKPVKAKEIVRAKDVRMKKTTWDNMRPRTAISARDLVGKQAVHRLAPNRPISRSAVKEPPMIARGSEITLLATGLGIRILQPAIAQEDGKKGQFIRIRPNSGTRTLRAKVVSAQEVKIDLEVSQ